MRSFAMKGYKGKTVHAHHSRTKLDIKGCWMSSGPQVVGGEGGCPEWIYELFEANKDLTSIALSTNEDGVLYQPMKGGDE